MRKYFYLKAPHLEAVRLEEPPFSYLKVALLVFSSLTELGHGRPSVCSVCWLSSIGSTEPQGLSQGR